MPYLGRRLISRNAFVVMSVRSNLSLSREFADMIWMMSNPDSYSYKSQVLYLNLLFRSCEVGVAVGYLGIPMEESPSSAGQGAG